MQRHISWVTPEEKELEEKLFAEYSPDNVRTHLEYLTTLKRWAGSEDELKAARYIKETLDSSGVDSEIYDVDAYISHPKEASLEILSPVQKSLPCLPRIFVTPTPPEGIEAELVSVGKGSEKDFQAVDVKGKIVLIPGDRLSRRYVAPVAREKGALAQIHITPGTLRVINYGGIRNTWGSPTLETFDKEPKTTAIAICNEDGDYLEALTKQGPVVVRLKADSWSGYTSSCGRSLLQLV
jgi:hypothetical protein